MKHGPVRATNIEAKRGQTAYPEPYARQVAGRTKRKLGDAFGLKNFGVNLTHLEPGTVSALAHAHQVQDEFVYILAGTPTVIIGDQEYLMSPGDCIGFKAGTGLAHQLVNRTQDMVSYIEIGDRMLGDQVVYPNDDLAAQSAAGGSWAMTHKDGTPY